MHRVHHWKCVDFHTISPHHATRSHATSSSPSPLLSTLATPTPSLLWRMRRRSPSRTADTVGVVGGVAGVPWDDTVLVAVVAVAHLVDAMPAVVVLGVDVLGAMTVILGVEVAAAATAVAAVVGVRVVVEMTTVVTTTTCRLEQVLTKAAAASVAPLMAIRQRTATCVPQRKVTRVTPRFMTHSAAQCKMLVTSRTFCALENVLFINGKVLFTNEKGLSHNEKQLWHNEKSSFTAKNSAYVFNGAVWNRQSAMLKRQSAMLKRQSAMLKRQSTMLKRQSAMLKRQWMRSMRHRAESPSSQARTNACECN